MKITSIFKNRTLEHHDTMRQVSRSEMPSGFTESIRYIVQSDKPKASKWGHLCPCAGMSNRVFNEGHICPDCFIGQDGRYHGRREEKGCDRSS